MARIRSIKPEFFRHEALYEAERETGLPLRLAFAGLWTAADREGRFRWSPRQLKLDCLPYDDCDFSRVLDALATRGFIVRYASDEKEYGCIPSWQQHQIINNREKASDLPAPNENNVLTREPRVDDASLTPLKSAQGERKGREGERKGKENTPPVAEATRGASEKFEEFWKERPRRDGDDPRKPAEKKFNALVKTGVDPDMIISGAKLASTAARERGIYGTKFVPQTIKWLNDQRFIDYAAAAYVGAQPATSLFYAKDGSEQLDAWDAYTVQTTGRHLPRDRNQGWHVATEWPPGYEQSKFVQPPTIPHLRSMDS